jgi:hypothetical protein
MLTGCCHSCLSRTLMHGVQEGVLDTVCCDAVTIGPALIGRCGLRISALTFDEVIALQNRETTPDGREASSDH